MPDAPRTQVGGRSQNLVDLVDLNAEAQPHAVSLVFEGRVSTYANLRMRSQSWGAKLSRVGVSRGDRVVIVLDNSAEFFDVFFGVLRLGAVAVSLSPKSKDNRIIDITGHCGASLVVATASFWSTHEALRQSLQTAIPLDAGQDCPVEAPMDFPRVSPQSHAFLQYTSGTTGFSKGVCLTHEAVLANLRSMNARLPVDPTTDVFTSMLPLYHDMGLVGFGLYSLFTSAKLVLFLQDIRSIYSWLGSFSEHRATISGASNSMLHLTRRVVSDPNDYDLSSLRIMLCGSEPLYHTTLENFETDYRVSRVLVPAYGLAEATLCLTMGDPGAGVHVDSQQVVSCGRPLDDVKIRIDQPDAHGVGEVLALTPAAMAGYFHAPSDSATSFAEDGFLRTGDLGYLDAKGNLFLLGRKKNVIIRDGENRLPGELEEVALRHTAIRNACVVGVRLPGGDPRERIVLVAEVKLGTLRDPKATSELHKAILAEATRSCNYLPDQVYFVPPVTIPFSPNGKMQHQRMKEILAQDEWSKIEKVIS